MLIDTHCHLDPGYYPDGPDQVIERARAAGVGAIVAIGVGQTLDPARFALEVADRRADVWATVGLHPHDAKVHDASTRAGIATLCRRPRVVAVGEIGLDFHYMHSGRDKQLEVFRELVGLARELALPIVVHTREAPAETLAILEEEGARDVGGIIHCFSEDIPFARRALDLDFDLSFSGIVTFKNARSVQETAAWAPADRILVETDSPYLAPVPFRGKPCEPAYVAHTARRMAELRGVAFEEICRRTTENAVRRLRLAGPGVVGRGDTSQT
jgi:TatD DNase family protein